VGTKFSTQRTLVNIRVVNDFSVYQVSLPYFIDFLRSKQFLYLSAQHFGALLTVRAISCRVDAQLKYPRTLVNDSGA